MSALKGADQLIAEQKIGAQALSQGLDGYVDEKGNVIKFDPLLVPTLSFGAGAALKAAGGKPTEGGPGSVILGAFIGERGLKNIDDKVKVNDITGKELKKNFNEATIEFDRIQDLTASDISKELKNLGFKSQASMSPALQRKLLEEYKIRKPYRLDRDWETQS